MERDCVNAYKSARLTAGLTQERWAEEIGVSVDSVRLYESGKGLPSDDVVQTMIEVAMVPYIGYQHFINKSSLAAEILPDVQEVSLPQAVVQLLGALRSFQNCHRVDELLQIAADGVVSGAEEEQYSEILEDLQEIVDAAMAVKFARTNKKAPADAGTSTRAGHGRAMRTRLK